MRLNYPDILPITSHRQQIVKAIEENQVVVVVGETGSGKSTQIPKMIIEALSNIQKTDPEFTRFKIACTQPRRIAAVSISSWIAHEMGVEPGQQVGYKIRFDDDTTAGTIITVCTDGILLQEMKGDGLLSRYDAILVDEAHERNLNIDFLLGLLNDIQVKRREKGMSELKILITSATFDAGKFADFFASLNTDTDGKLKPVPVINVSGRLFPVDVNYNPVQSNEDIYKKIAGLVRQIAEGPERGDALIFLPGESEIFHTIREIEMLGKNYIQCLPLYSRLSMTDQELIYQNYPGKMKVVVSTNIAETSLTVPGIKYVIDSGLARMTDFNFRTGIGSLEVRPVSQASAIQRAGRAGRVQAGICYRLYSQRDFEERDKYTKPEIQRSDLSSVVLHMLLIGIKDLTGFDFIDAPEPKAFRNAISNLIELGALDENQNLTELGVKMAHLPLEPRISAMLLAAEKYDCVNEVAVIASSLSVKDPFLRPNGEEDEADRAKRNFQKMAMSGGPRYKTLRIRKGRRILTKRVMDKSFVDQELVSDLMVFLVVWNRLQSIEGEEQREYFCQSNYLNHLMFKEISQIYKQLLDTLNIFAKDEFSKYLLKEGQSDWSVDLSKKEGILKSISSGFIQNLCESLGKQTYRMRSTENIFIHPGSALFPYNPKYFVSAEIVETTRLFARNNTAIDPRWLEEIAPQLCRYKRGLVYFDRKLGKAVREEEVSFRSTRIVKDRLVDVAKSDPVMAMEFLVKEGLVKKLLASRYTWIGENDKLISKLKVYAARMGKEHWNISSVRLRDWYWNRLQQAGKPLVSVQELDKFLEKKGADFLKLKIEEIVTPEEMKELSRVFPEQVYLAGKPFRVEYVFDDYRYPSGPLITLEKEDLITLDDEIVQSNLRQYDQLQPYFVVKAGSAPDQQAVIGEGRSILEIRQEIDRWHLKKNLKKIRREQEIRPIKFDEIWHYVPDLMGKVEVGASMFNQGPGAMVYVYVGLRLDGKKIIRTIFENPEVAWKATLDVFKAYFQWMVKYDFYFREKEVKELEKIYQTHLYGIELMEVLEAALWKELAFEKKFLPMGKFSSVEQVKKIMQQQKEHLEDSKKNVFKSLQGVLKRMDKLAASEKSEDLQELSRLKQSIQSADFPVSLPVH
jgi:ATP-dependent helicase HrpA